MKLDDIVARYTTTEQEAEALLIEIRDLEAEHAKVCKKGPPKLQSFVTSLRSAFGDDDSGPSDVASVVAKTEADMLSARDDELHVLIEHTTNRYSLLLQRLRFLTSLAGALP